MVQKGQKQEGVSCGEVFAVCGSTHKAIASYPYIWQQHVSSVDGGYIICLLKGEN